MKPLVDWWRQQQFHPGRFGIVANPFYFARRGLEREITPLLAELQGEVLDVGCGRKPYRRAARVSRYIGVDIDTPATRALAAADFYYDGRNLPFEAGSFDGILCSQVLEHVFDPEPFLRELGRVLRSGGRLVLTTPFVWDEHEQPNDYGRYSSFGLRILLERCGFVVQVQRKSVADARAVVQVASAWIYKATRSRHRSLNLVAQVGLIAPINIVGAAAAFFLPHNPDFYLDNAVLAAKAT